MKKVVISAGEEFINDEKLIKKTLTKLEKILNLDDKYLEVYLVGDSFMKKNVLSFEASEDFPHPETRKFKPLGEVYLNPKYIRENNEDLAYMLVHGLLHLLGYSHDKESDRMKMEAKEREITKKLLISNI